MWRHSHVSQQPESALLTTRLQLLHPTCSLSLRLAISVSRADLCECSLGWTMKDVKSWLQGQHMYVIPKTAASISISTRHRLSLHTSAAPLELLVGQDWDRKLDR